MRLTNKTLTYAAALAALVACHTEMRMPERRPKVVRSEIECEVYQGSLPGDGEMGILGFLIFDPMPPHARGLQPDYALFTRPGLEDSLKIGERYCFTRDPIINQRIGQIYPDTNTNQTRIGP